MKYTIDYLILFIAPSPMCRLRKGINISNNNIHSQLKELK